MNMPRKVIIPSIDELISAGLDQKTAEQLHSVYIDRARPRKTYYIRLTDDEKTKIETMFPNVVIRSPGRKRGRRKMLVNIGGENDT